MVEDLAAAASNPSFSGSVLPWGLNARPFCLKSGGLQERKDIGIEDRIAIQNEVAIRSRLRKGFSQLLHDPIGRGVPGNVEVQDPAAPVLDDEQTVQHPEGRSWHGEEVEGDDGLAVVAKKRKPFFGRITPALDPPQIARDSPLGEHEAELLQLAVDLRRAPAEVLLRQTPNQNANFLTDRRPAATRPGFPAPIQPETSSMPADDRFGIDDYECILPARPSRPQDRPEEPIQRAQRRPGPPPLQDSHLLSKGEDFDSHVSAALEKDAGGGNQGEDKWQHGLLGFNMTLRPRRPRGPLDRTPLNSLWWGYGNTQRVHPRACTTSFPGFQCSIQIAKSGNDPHERQQD